MRQRYDMFSQVWVLQRLPARPSPTAAIEIQQVARRRSGNQGENLWKKVFSVEVGPGKYRLFRAPPRRHRRHGQPQQSRPQMDAGGLRPHQRPHPNRNIHALRQLPQTRSLDPSPAPRSRTYLRHGDEVCGGGDDRGLMVTETRTEKAALRYRTDCLPDLKPYGHRCDKET